MSLLEPNEMIFTGTPRNCSILETYLLSSNGNPAIDLRLTSSIMDSVISPQGSACSYSTLTFSSALKSDGNDSSGFPSSVYEIPKFIELSFPSVSIFVREIESAYL